jgi:uncharacterized membrane protein YfcA
LVSAGFDLDFFSFAAIFLAFALGGILKGATGAGTPVIAIPVLTIFFDVQLAVIIMVTSNLISNLIQIFNYRKAEINRVAATRLAGSGVLGCIFGTFILANASPLLLEVIVAFSTILYISMKLLKPNLVLPQYLCNRLSIPIGFAGGVIQGSAGISAPIALSFLNAMRITRESFIFTISSFFGSMAAVQIITLGFLNMLTWPLIIISAAALIPQLLFMPVGNVVAKNMSNKNFENVILVLLSLLCLKLIYSVFS